jgi:hypothetical protein
VHVVHAVVFRRYNPGLVTALIVFIPLGIFTLRQADLAGAGSLAAHAGDPVFAVAVHAIILVRVQRKLAFMRRGHA